MSDASKAPSADIEGFDALAELALDRPAHPGSTLTCAAYFSIVIDRLPGMSTAGTYLKQKLQDKLIEHKRYIYKDCQDMPEIRNWQWDASIAPRILKKAG